MHHASCSNSDRLQNPSCHQPATRRNGLDLEPAGRFSLVAPPLEWARVRIRAGREVGPLPLYGDAAWQLLPARDARRWGACLVAAEAWRDFRSA